MFERMQNVRERLGEEYRNPTSSTLHDELTIISRWSVLADRTTHARASELIELDRQRRRILLEGRTRMPTANESLTSSRGGSMKTRFKR